MKWKNTVWKKLKSFRVLKVSGAYSNYYDMYGWQLWVMAIHTKYNCQHLRFTSEARRICFEPTFRNWPLVKVGVFRSRDTVWRLVCSNPACTDCPNRLRPLTLHVICVRSPCQSIWKGLIIYERIFMKFDTLWFSKVQLKSDNRRRVTWRPVCISTRIRRVSRLYVCGQKISGTVVTKTHTFR